MKERAKSYSIFLITKTFILQNWFEIVITLYHPLTEDL